MIKRNDLPKLEEDLENIMQSLTEKEVRKALRKPLIKESRAMRKAVSADLSTALSPHNLAANDVDTAVRAKVYRTSTGFRIHVSNKAKGCVYTGRPSQKRLPLPFWYEGGFKADRRTRGKWLRKKSHSTGPAIPVEGVHIIDKYEPKLAAANERLHAEAQGYLDHVAEVYGK